MASSPALTLVPNTGGRLREFGANTVSAGTIFGALIDPDVFAALTAGQPSYEFTAYAGTAGIQWLNEPVRSEDNMADPTREEIDAKLAAVEARTETRFMELSGKLDRVVDALGSLRSEVAAVRSDNKFTRLTIIVAVVGSVIAGLAALWVTQSNMLASFSAGIALHEVPPVRR